MTAIRRFISRKTRPGQPWPAQAFPAFILTTWIAFRSFSPLLGIASWLNSRSSQSSMNRSVRTIISRCSNRLWVTCRARTAPRDTTMESGSRKTNCSTQAKAIPACTKLSLKSSWRNHTRRWFCSHPMQLITSLRHRLAKAITCPEKFAAIGARSWSFYVIGRPAIYLAFISRQIIHTTSAASKRKSHSKKVGKAFKHTLPITRECFLFFIWISLSTFKLFQFHLFQTFSLNPDSHPYDILDFILGEGYYVCLKFVVACFRRAFNELQVLSAYNDWAIENKWAGKARSEW